MSTFVSKEQDGFILEQMEKQARWVCLLSDGTSVYQDDDRPGVWPLSAWTRLREYLENTGLTISEMRLQFKTHVETVADGERSSPDAWFFCRSALGEWGSAVTEHYFIAGTYKNGSLMTKKWKVPELVLVAESCRDVKDSAGCLIWTRKSES